MPIAFFETFTSKLDMLTRVPPTNRFKAVSRTGWWVCLEVTLAQVDPDLVEIAGGISRSELTD